MYPTMEVLASMPDALLAKIAGENNVEPRDSNEYLGLQTGHSRFQWQP
tara:strand:- start:234 stop:377 length:144 start_codon:yes stop_codon:yes gene_type:complete